MFAFAEVPLELVEISILTKSEISWSKYQKVPILTLNGLQVNDSYIIFKTLAPLVFGRAVSEAEAGQIKAVSFEAMISLEAETFENNDAVGKFVDGYIAKDCCTGATLGNMAKLMMPQMAGQIRAKHPDLKPFKTHCETFKGALKGKFAGGGEPGPYDVMMYGLFVLHKQVKIDMYEAMWSELGLNDWYEAMAGVMASKPPIFE